MTIKRSTAIQTTRKQGFTLVETMVVVGIIVILAAISSAVFVRVRQAAKNTSCLNNLSQIGKAALLYMGSNDDYYPPFMTYAHGKNPNLVPPEAGKWVDALNVYGAKGVWKCPSDPDLGGPDGSISFFRSEVRGIASYETAGGLALWEGIWPDGRLKLSGSTAPAARAYASDIWFSAKDGKEIVTVHDKQSHSVCMDGHVISEPIQQQSP